MKGVWPKCTQDCSESEGKIMTFKANCQDTSAVGLSGSIKWWRKTQSYKFIGSTGPDGDNHIHAVIHRLLALFAI
jgi:hypothetical protein